MSIYNTEFDNEYKARMKMFMCDDLYQKNYDTGQFERVVSGVGPEPVVLPYYLHSNSVKVDNVGVTSYSQLDENSVDVVDVTNNKSSSLLSDRLVIGDVSGNVELNKGSIEAANSVRDITSIVPTDSTQKVVLYDSAAGSFHETDKLILDSSTATASLVGNILKLVPKSSPGSYLNLTTSSILNYDDTLKRLSSLGLLSLKFGSSNGYGILNTDNNYSELSSTSLVLKNANGTNTLTPDSIAAANKLIAPTNLSVNHDHKAVVFNTVTGAYNTIDIAYQWMAANDLRNKPPGDPLASTNRVLMVEAGTGAYSVVNLNDTFAAANKIRDMTSAAVDANKKMVTFDAVTSNLNYTDIPATVTLPYYVKPTQLEFTNPDTSSKVFVNGPYGEIQSQNTGGEYRVSINGRVGAIDFTNPTVGTSTLYPEDVKYLNQQRKPYFYNAVETETLVIDTATTVYNSPVKQFTSLVDGDRLVVKCNDFYYDKQYAIRLTSGYNAVIRASYAGAFTGFNYADNQAATIEYYQLNSGLPATDDGTPTPYDVPPFCTVFSFKSPGKISSDTITAYVIFEKIVSNYTTLTPITPS